MVGGSRYSRYLHESIHTKANRWIIILEEDELFCTSISKICIFLQDFNYFSFLTSIVFPKWSKRINVTRSRRKFNFKFNLSPPRNSREIGRPFFDRWIDRETGTFRRWCCSRNRWRFSLKSEPRRSTEKRKRGWSAFSSPRIVPRRARNLKNRAKSPGIGNGDRWRGKERERLLGLSFLLLSRSSRYPFSSSRDPSWNQIQFQTDLSLSGWEKSVVVPLDLSGRGSLRTLSTSDQKQGGCYNKLGDSNARNACQYRGNLRTEWTHSRGKLLLLPSKRKEEPAWVDFFIAVRIKFLNQKMRKWNLWFILLCSVYIYLVYDRFLCSSMFFIPN